MKIYEIQHPTKVIASLSFEKMLLLRSMLCNALLVMTQRANTHQTDKMSNQYTNYTSMYQFLRGYSYKFQHI